MEYLPKISIIVPVYNAEKSIRRCVESLIASDVPIEVVCVDDGSADGSGSILEKLAMTDPRVRVFHQKNAGAAAARNQGLQLARGEYIMFCDADDQYLENTVTVIYDDLWIASPDYLVFHRQTLRTDGQMQHWGSPSNFHQISCNWSQYWNDVYYSRRHGGGVINKVYKRALILKHRIQFDPQLHFGEDIWFNLTYTMHAQRMFEDYRAVYQQYQTQGSICMSRQDDFYEKNLMCIKLFERTYPDQADELQTFFSRFQFQTAVRAIDRLMMGNDGRSNSERNTIIEKVLNDDDLIRRMQYLREHEITDTEAVKMKYLQDKNMCGYYWKYHTIPRVRGRIKRLIGR